MKAGDDLNNSGRDIFSASSSVHSGSSWNVVKEPRRHRRHFERIGPLQEVQFWASPATSSVSEGQRHRVERLVWALVPCLGGKITPTGKIEANEEVHLDPRRHPNQSPTSIPDPLHGEHEIPSRLERPTKRFGEGFEAACGAPKGPSNTPRTDPYTTREHGPRFSAPAQLPGKIIYIYIYIY